MRLIGIGLAVAGVLLFCGLPVFAEDGEWNTVGLRGGFGDSNNNQSFNQYEAYATFSLPWRWESDARWILGSFIGVNAGMVRCENNAFIGSIGPGIYLLSPTRRIVLSAGIYPTYLAESTLGTEDFGGSLQFTSAVGLSYKFYQLLIVGYRFQHMSNAGIYDENPGLDTHMIELGFRF